MTVPLVRFRRETAWTISRKTVGPATGQARARGIWRPARTTPLVLPVLEVVLDLLQRIRVDEVAQLLLPEQLAQQVAIERQRRRPPLGVRRVALVHVRRDV